MARGVYSYSAQAQTVSTAITILELTAPSTAVLRLIRAWISANTTTAAAINPQILRKSVACTGTASPPTPRPIDASAASGVAQRWKATAEGTAGDILYSEFARADGGPWIWLPLPDERIIVPPSGIIALKFATAPASNSFDFGFIYEELG
jgi:hypothetical protein